jgi:hypothetical protein
LTKTGDLLLLLRQLLRQSVVKDPRPWVTWLPLAVVLLLQELELALVRQIAQLLAGRASAPATADPKGSNTGYTGCGSHCHLAAQDLMPSGNRCLLVTRQLLPPAPNRGMCAAAVAETQRLLQISLARTAAAVCCQTVPQVPDVRELSSHSQSAAVLCAPGSL